MAVLDLEEGDIIVQSGADHCVMWVGGNEPLAHAVSPHGVIQQSDTYFRNNAPVSLGDHTVWRLTATSRKGKEDLAENAAGVARDWAVNRQRNDNRPATPFGNTRWLKTYTDNISDEKKKKKLTSKWDDAAAVFDAQSVYQILKMYTRTSDRSDTVPLSANKGVSCSQFVIYSYQIASLVGALGFKDRKQLVNEEILKNPGGAKAREVQMGATESKDANALLAAEEALTEYTNALSKIQKFKDKKQGMEDTLGKCTYGYIHESLLPSLHTTTRFLTSEFLVEKFLPLSFEIKGSYLPYCGDNKTKQPTIVQFPHKINDRDLTAKTLFKVAYEKLFNEPPGSQYRL